MKNNRSVKKKRLRTAIEKEIIQYLWVFIGLAVMILAGSLKAWHTLLFWQIRYARPLVGLTSVGYLVTAVVFIRLNLFPKSSKIGVAILSVSINFFIVIAVIAFLRFYYSRSYLFVFYMINFFWLLIGLGLYGRITKLPMGVIPEGIGKDLLKLKTENLFELIDPETDLEMGGVVVDLHEEVSQGWVRFLANCSIKKIPIYHAAIIYENITGKVSIRHIAEGIVDEIELKKLYLNLKRVLDTILILISLPISLPLFLVTCLAIKIDSRGPVFFRQERVGQNGKIFKMVKFRSMRVDSEKHGNKFAEKNDVRITRVGRFIRKYRIDEIPQFWNIIKGEMSLIGPRPEQVVFAKSFEEKISYYAYRHLVKPGITGWAQVIHGYAYNVENTYEKLEYDLYYIKYLSFWFDVQILLKTLKTIFTGFGSR